MASPSVSCAAASVCRGGLDQIDQARNRQLDDSGFQAREDVNFATPRVRSRSNTLFRKSGVVCSERFLPSILAKRYHRRKSI